MTDRFQNTGAPAFATAPHPTGETRSCCECGSLDVADCGACRPYGDAVSLKQDAEPSAPLDPGRLYFCRSCGLGFRYPASDAEQLSRLYSQLDSTRWKYDPNQMCSWLGAAAFLKKHLAPSARVLDIGCYDGAFLQTLPTTWKKSAIEPAVSAHGVLRELGVRVVGRLLEAPVAEDREQFDAVTLFDVLEHLEHPAQALTNAYDYVAPGGYLLVFTGNCEHWTWSVLQGNHWYLDSVQHLRFASRRYFRKSAIRLGAQVREMHNLSHQKADRRQKLQDVLEVISHGMFSRGHLGRITSNWLRRLTHMPPRRETAPYTTSLADHVLVVLQRPH